MNLFYDLPCELINYIYSFNDKNDHMIKYTDTLSMINRCKNFTIGQTFELNINVLKYAISPKFNYCINHNHEILIKKPYGVSTNCLNCGLYEYFEWKDSESNWWHLKKDYDVKYDNILPGYPHYIGYRQ